MPAAYFQCLFAEKNVAAAPKAYDFESVLTHELGHFLGFSHSAVWSAMMFPFAPAPETISGTRPSSPMLHSATTTALGCAFCIPTRPIRSIRAPSAEELFL
ncbi:MAG: hypothetical protein DMG39_17570 [Acidobacteria bacterium]|nr:MAG: hypothetical protein DMG39_17570 [Acidobacteriota bacterium]